MTVSKSSLDFIKLVAHGLGELNEKAFFIGGATIPFYLPSNRLAAARPTEDVDVVLEILRPIDLGNVEKVLRAKGFIHDTSTGAPACRWKFRGATVDILSPNEGVMGFTSQWYKGAMENALVKDLGGISVKIFTLPFFLATKIEAFKGRGNSDFIGSHDMEDIVTIIDLAEQDLLEGVIQSHGDGVVQYLKAEFSQLMENRDFIDAIPGHISDRENLNSRVDAVLARIGDLIA